MLRILKNYKTPSVDVDKSSFVMPLATLAPPVTPPAAASPSWRGMSSRLLQRLSVADEAIPEMQMPASPVAAPSNRSKG